MLLQRIAGVFIGNVTDFQNYPPVKSRGKCQIQFLIAGFNSIFFFFPPIMTWLMCALQTGILRSGPHLYDLAVVILAKSIQRLCMEATCQLDNGHGFSQGACCPQDKQGIKTASTDDTLLKKQKRHFDSFLAFRFSNGSLSSSPPTSYLTSCGSQSFKSLCVIGGQ